MTTAGNIIQRGINIASHLIPLRKRKNVLMKWDPLLKVFKVSVQTPDLLFNRVRLYINESYQDQAGLSEVQIYYHSPFINSALGCKTAASEEYGKKKKKKFSSDKIVDDIIDQYKKRTKKGYWLIKNGTGWIDIYLEDIRKGISNSVNSEQ